MGDVIKLAVVQEPLGEEIKGDYNMIINGESGEEGTLS